MEKNTTGINPFPSKTEEQMFAESIGTSANVLVSAGHEPLTSVLKSHYAMLVHPSTKKPYATQGTAGMTLPVLLKKSGK